MPCPKHPEKLTFGTKRAALRIARKLRKNRGVRAHAYRCPACGEFHLTSQTAPSDQEAADSRAAAAARPAATPVPDDAIRR